MKTTQTLQDFVLDLQDRRDSMQDFIVPAKMITVNPAGLIEIPIESNRSLYSPLPKFDEQLVSDLGRPNKITFQSQFYHDIKRVYPEQWAGLVNAMLQTDPRARMVRTLKDNARAYLSNSYQRIDNWQVAEVALSIIEQKADWEVVGSQVTDSRLYIKVMTPWRADIASGKRVRAGFILENGELGDCAVSVRFLIEMEWCTNGAIRETASKMRHATRALLPDFANGAYIMSNETQDLQDRFVMSQLRDMIHQTVNQKAFDNFVSAFSASTRDEIPTTVDVQRVLDVTGKQFGLRDTEKTSIMNRLARGEKLQNRFDVIDHVTYIAQHVDDYDRSVELEKIGGEMIMKADKWETIIREASKKQPSTN